MKSFGDAHLLGGEYLVVEERYSWVIFTSEYKPCANLGMQEQSVQMTSHCPCLMFTWRRNAGLKGANLYKSEISDRRLFSLGVQESSKHGIAWKKWNGTQLAWYELQIFGHMRSDLRKIFTRVCVTRWAFCFTHLEHDDVIKWNIFRVTGPLCGHRGAFMFSLTCAWMKDSVNNRETGDLKSHCAHYDVTWMVMHHSRYNPRDRNNCHAAFQSIGPTNPSHNVDDENIDL